MTRPSLLARNIRGVIQVSNQRFATLSTQKDFLNFPTNESAKEYSRLSSQGVLSDIRSAISKHNLGNKSLKAGHKIVAARTTLLPRLNQAVNNVFSDKLGDLKKQFGAAAVKQKIDSNPTYIRYTAHPTEGQNLRAIEEKDGVVKIQTLYAQTLKQSEASYGNIVKLSRIAKNFGQEEIAQQIISEAKLGTLTAEKFQQHCNNLRAQLLESFIVNPIHHITKMTIQDERNLLIYHMDRSRKETATIISQHPDLVTHDNLKFSSWGGDMDGKPHVEAGTAAILEFQAQQKFFTSLKEMLEDFALKLELQSYDHTDFRSAVLEKVIEIQQENSQQILTAQDAKKVENEILDLLHDFDKNEENSLGLSFKEIENYVRSSSCKTAPIVFTTREEIDKTNAAITEIKEKCGGLDAKKVAEKFSELSSATKRQLMCQMEAASLHPQHEHIISQFDCELESFKNTIAIFELAKQLPQHHQSIPYFAEYYNKKSAEAGFDLYQQFFSENAIAKVQQSVVQVSPLAEDSDTIPKLIGFTKAMLADQECVDYIRKSGGIVRQTRSNSDGSSSMGAQKVVISYLEADSAIRKMVTDAGFEFSVLQGIGANDLERMAPWNLELLQGEFTAQGSDGQHQTRDRFISMLLKNKDTSEEQFQALQERSPEQFARLVEFYYQLHIISEHGVQIELNGKKVNSGNLTHRGPIQAGVAKELGKLSSRPDNRTGSATSNAIEENTPEVWDPLVYNNDMRRIGAISLQRISGISTFCLAPFYQKPSQDIDGDVVAEFSAIPLIQNINISAIFALGVTDLKSFKLVNGFDYYVPESSITATAEIYQKFLDINHEKGETAAMQFAKENGFDEASKMRGAHMCYQIEGCRHVLRNAITPLIANSSQKTKDELEKVFVAAESGDSIKKYNDHVIAACQILVQDPTLDLSLKGNLAYAAQQIANVHQKGNYWDTRAKLIEEAHDSLNNKDLALFDEKCQSLAIITRSAGNPISPGSKTHEKLPFFMAHLKNTLLYYLNLTPEHQNNTDEAKTCYASR